MSKTLKEVTVIVGQYTNAEAKQKTVTSVLAQSLKRATAKC